MSLHNSWPSMGQKLVLSSVSQTVLGRTIQFQHKHCTIPMRLRNARMHTQLMSATRKSFLLSELWSTCSQGNWAAQVEIKYENIWRFWRSHNGESDWVSYCIGSTRQHYDHCMQWTARTTFLGAAVCLSHAVQAAEPCSKMVAPLRNLV